MELSTNCVAAANAGTLLVIRHRITGEPLGTEKERPALRIHGKDSERYQSVEAAIDRENVEAASRTRGKFQLTREEVKQQVVRKYAACVSGWEHCAYNGDETFSPTAITKLLTNEPWLLDQVASAVEDRASFPDASPTS